MKLHRALFALCALAVLVSLAACGGGDDDGDDFVAKADAVCIEAAKKRVATQDEIVRGEKAVLAQLSDQQKVRKDTTAQLAKLEPPEESAAAFERYLRLRRELVAQAAKEPALVRRGVSAEAAEYQKFLVRFEKVGDEMEAAAADAGLKACASILPKKVRNQVVAVVTEFETEPMENCRDFVTDTAIEELFGGLKECQKAQGNPPPAGFTKKVTIQNVRGVEGVQANVQAALEGGVNDGQEVEYALVFEDGSYKVNAAFLQPQG